MRFDFDSYREIGDALVRNKSRSLLTGFGIFWGLFMLLYLVGGGQGLKRLLSANFEGFASNSLIMVAQNTSKPYKGFQEGRYWNFTSTDIERLRQMVPEAETITGQIAGYNFTSQYEGRSTDATLKGISYEYAAIEAPRIKYGRYINEIDVLNERKVCVIGKRIYNDLFPDGGDPCGKFIQVGSSFFQIIGVDFSSGNITINGNSTTSISVPVSIAQKLLQRGNVVDIICVAASSDVKVTSLEPKIRQIMSRQHSFDPTDESALMILNLEQIFSLVDTLFRGVDFLILLVGLGTLLAGAIGVSNIMMVTVKERTVEIGIRRAIGAMPKDILSQIIRESIALTLVAGSIGIVFSVFALRLTEILTQDQASFQISFWTAALAMLLLSVLGAVAGLAPAIRAMNIKPVDAMRDE